MLFIIGKRKIFASLVVITFIVFFDESQTLTILTGLTKLLQIRLGLHKLLVLVKLILNLESETDSSRGCSLLFVPVITSPPPCRS